MVDFGQIVVLSLAGLTCLLAVFAIVNEYRANNIDRDDGPRCKQLSRFGTYGAVFCGVLAFAIFGVNTLLRTPQKAQADAADSKGLVPGQPNPDLHQSGEPAGGAQPKLVQAPPPVSPATSPSVPTPTVPPPTFQSGSPGVFQPVSSGSSGYSWGSPSQPGRRDDDDHERHEAAERRPKKIPYPFTPVAYTVVLRFSTEDPVLKPYVDRVLHEAERDSGIALTASNDKFASLHIMPTSEVAYADGKQAQINRAGTYVARKDEAAAKRYLFDPQICVTVAQENGARATFSKAIPWGSIKKDQGTDTIDVYIFPKRKRVVLTVTANCAPLQGQFPDGAPSVFDLRGGTVAVQLLRAGDVAAPKPVDLDDVDKHCADESMRLEAPMAPRVRSTIVSILCATSPAGSVELGTDDATIERSSVDREAIEVCGPVTLRGIPPEPPTG